MTFPNQSACKWSQAGGRPVDFWGPWEGDREVGREEGRGQGEARVESKRQKFNIFTQKVEEGTSVPQGWARAGVPAPQTLSWVHPVPWCSRPEPGPSGWLSPNPHQPSITPCPLPAAKGRAISLPMDLDAHISSLLSSGASCAAAAQRNASSYKSTTRAFPRVTPTANQWDYKNIIEKLQVGVGLPGVHHGFGRACSQACPFLCCPHSLGRGWSARPPLRGCSGKVLGRELRGIIPGLALM